MKQTRRGFLGTFAAIAAAVAVSPSAKADAAPETVRTYREPYTPMDDPDRRALPYGENVWFKPQPILNREASLTALPLAFEAMQKDCAARGCRLKIHPIDDGWQLLTHYPEMVHTQANLEFKGTGGMSTVLTRVDAWRRPLHG